MDRIRRSERAEAFLSGDGKIKGTVRDPAGDPVEGVIVTAVPDAQPSNISLARRAARKRPHEDRDLSEVAQEAIQSELWRRYARRTAQTAAGGRFEITGLVDANHTLTAFHPRYDVQPLSQKGKVRPGTVVDFLARPVAEVKVEVRLPDGSLAEYAWLRWEGPQGEGADVWTRQQGKARLPLGSVKLKAQIWLPEPMESEQVEATVRAGSESSILLELKGRRLLSVSLVLPPGIVLPRRVAYRLRRLEGSGPIEPKSLLKNSSQPPNRTPSPGRAYWIDLEPGRYLVAAFLDQRRLIGYAEADLGEGTTELALPMEEPENGSYVTVRLLGPDGGPIPGQVSFRAVTGPEKRPRTQRMDAIQAGDGAWLAFLDNLDRKDRGPATLRVGTRDFGGATHALNLRAGGTITIRFDKPARLAVNVRRLSGSDVEGSLFVALRSEFGADAWQKLPASGEARLKGVQPGAYKLMLYVRRRGRTWPIHQRPIQLRGGERELSVAVPALHTLRVRWKGKRRAGAVVLRCSQESIGTFRRDARLNRRVATFDALAAGSYTIQCAGKKATVHVPGPPEVALP